MKGVTAGAVAACALAVAPAALAGTITMHPTSTGSHTIASWRAMQGLPDTVGAADQAVWLESLDPDENDVAAEDFTGLEGVPVQSLTGLEWEHRNDSDCGKVSPRWTLVVNRRGKQRAVRFGCALAAHSPGSAPGWTRDHDSQAFLRAQILKAGGKDLLLGTVESLTIVYDVRGKFGYSVLDNIVVGSTVAGTQQWTCAADNAETIPGPPKRVANDRLAEPLSEAEGMTVEELWPMLTADEQALATTQEPITE